MYQWSYRTMPKHYQTSYQHYRNITKTLKTHNISITYIYEKHRETGFAFNVSEQLADPLDMDIFIFLPSEGRSRNRE